LNAEDRPFQSTRPGRTGINVGSYGDYCSGQDPEWTGCSADAVTVAQTPSRYGILDLRWTNDCKTNWAS